MRWRRDRHVGSSARAAMSVDWSAGSQRPPPRTPYRRRRSGQGAGRSPSPCRAVIVDRDVPVGPRDGRRGMIRAPVAAGGPVALLHPDRVFEEQDVAGTGAVGEQDSSAWQRLGIRRIADGPGTRIGGARWGRCCRSGSLISWTSTPRCGSGRSPTAGARIARLATSLRERVKRSTASLARLPVFALRMRRSGAWVGPCGHPERMMRPARG